MKRLRISLAAMASFALVLTAGAASGAPGVTDTENEANEPTAAVVDWHGEDSDLAPHSSDRIFSASGWGSSVTGLDGVVNVGRTAPSMLGCTQRTNFRGENSIASVNIPGVAEIGAVSTFTRTGNAAGVETSIGGAQIAGASVLGGAIEVGAITSDARAHRHPAGNYTGSVTTTVASLSVLGQEIEITGGPQTIQVDGLATVILNSTRVRAQTTGVTSAGTAVTIRVLETGAEVRLGEVRAAIDGSGIDSFFTGQTYGSRLSLGGVVQSGPTALLNVPCLGTTGVPVTAQLAGIDLGVVGSISGIESTVSTSHSPRYEIQSSNTIAGVSLLAGLASIDGISSSVEVWRNPDGSLGYETDAEIASITVAGLPISVPIEPGSVVGLPGVGTLTFHKIEEINGGNGVAVTAATLELLGGQVLELGRSAGVILPLS